MAFNREKFVIFFDGFSGVYGGGDDLTVVLFKNGGVN